MTEECRRRTEALYSQIVDTVVPVSSPTVAETAKLHENTFRAVNIALANELALMCNHLGISVWEVVDAASSKPFAFLPHYPGPGLGGDCIPVVPHFAWRLREYGYSARLIDAAHEVNASMPQYVVQKVADALNESDRPIKGSRILLLGVAYKADVDDTRESPSLEVLRQLLLRGGDVSYCDPWVSEFELDEQTHRSVAWTPEAVEAADCIVLLTRTASSSSSRSGIAPGSSWTRATSRRRGLTSGPSRAPVRLLVLGAGYVGAKVAELALEDGHDVLLADNWWATRREQLDGVERSGARVETVDVRDLDAVCTLLDAPFDRVYLLAAQASRPLSISDPAYTEQTNLVGPRHVAEALAGHGARAALVYGSPCTCTAPTCAVRSPRTARTGARVTWRILEGLRRALPRPLRTTARLPARTPATGNRLRPRPGGA